MAEDRNVNTVYKEYLTENSRKEFWELLQKFRSNKIGLAVARGKVLQVHKNKYGTIFTLHNKGYVFKCIGDLSIDPEQEVYVKVFWDRGDTVNDSSKELYVMDFYDLPFPKPAEESQNNSYAGIPLGCFLLPGVLPWLFIMNAMKNNEER